MDVDRLKLNFEAAKYFSEMRSKILGYLFTAHGAGLIGCLSVIKDYSTVPQYKGLGVFIAVFAVGMLAAVLAYVASVLDDSTEMSAILDGKTLGGHASKLAHLVLVMLMSSASAFAWALINVALRYILL